MERLAIIGAGIAGMTACWQLKDKYSVTVFESEKELGGQIKTVTLDTKEGKVGVDMAVQIFSENTYPNLFEMFEFFNVPTYVSPLSFSAFFSSLKESWNNCNLIETELGCVLLEECNKFHLDMYKISQNYSLYSSYNLYEFLKEKKYSDSFISKALFPKLSILAGSRASLMDFSLGYCAALFNFRLLSFFTPPQWRRVKGGAKILVDNIENLCKGKVRFKKDCAVKKVTRTLSHIEIEDITHEKHTFDQVIFALHAETILSLLSDPDEKEKELLSSFAYDYATSVVHTSSNIFNGLASNDYREYPSCFYKYNKKEVNHDCLGSTTFNIAKIASFKNKESAIFMSINPEENIPNEQIIASNTWKHPKLRPSDMQTKQRIGKEQGKRKTWFCGLDTSSTGHEGALVSGLVIAEALDVPYPFTDKPSAKSYFTEVKKIMGMDAISSNS